nr:uncharacterized protein LOC109193258 [Ipomoea trifida]
MVKQLRFCDKKVQFWVKVKGNPKSRKTDLRKVTNDADILVLNLEVPRNKELDIYVEHLYDDQWDYDVEISRSLGDDVLLTDEGSEQESEREVDGPETVFEEVEVEVNGPTAQRVGNETEVDLNEVDCVHSEEIFRSLDDSDDERDYNGSATVFQQRNLKKEGFKFVLGMIFQSAKEFKWAVTYHEAMRRKDVKFVKNEARRVRAYCRHNDICKWTIFGSRSNPRCPFQIKTYNPEHTCGDQDDNKTVNSGFLARLYKEDFRLNMEWGRRQFQEHVQQKLHCQVTKHQAYRAKHKARKELEGQDSEQFNMLNDYFQEKGQQSSQVRTKKLGEVKRCRVCGLTGHNKTTCKAKNPQGEANTLLIYYFVKGSQEVLGSQGSQPLHNHIPQESSYISTERTTLTPTAAEEMQRLGLSSRTISVIQTLARPGNLVLLKRKR